MLGVTFVPRQGALTAGTEATTGSPASHYVPVSCLCPLCPACVHYVTCLSPASSAKEGSLVQGSSHLKLREHELSLATQLGQRSKFTKARGRGCTLDRWVRKEGARDFETPRALGASFISLQLLPHLTHP